MATTSDSEEVDQLAFDSKENTSENTQAGALSELGKPKRVRVNHNEIERKRRNAQKERLEELRLSVPALAAQERASTVNIIVRAREYIEQLRERIAELERYMAGRSPAVLNVSGAFTSQTMKAKTDPLGRGGAAPVAFAQHQQQLHHHLQPHQHQLPYTLIAPNPRPTELNQALLLAEAATSIASIEKPAMAKPSPGTKRQLPPATATAAVAERTSRHLPAHKRDSSSSGDDFLSLLQARKSSLILPAEDGVYFGKRSDSIHTFLTSGLSSVLEEAVQADILCAKCSRGINSLIMVDCERCHAWYHIRCLGMDARNIPVSWKCPECVNM